MSDNAVLNRFAELMEWNTIYLDSLYLLCDWLELRECAISELRKTNENSYKQLSLYLSGNK